MKDMMAYRHKTENNIENTYRFTGKGVFLSTATTMIGFGSLGLIGQYPAIAGMGAILFFGIAACLLTSFIILPALLGLRVEIRYRASPIDKEK